MHAYPAGDVSIAGLRYGQSVEKLTRFAWDALAPSTDGSAVLFRFKLSTKRGATQEGPAEFVADATMPFAQTLIRK